MTLNLRPKGSHDLSGWYRITCWQAEIVRRGDLSPASTFTDVDAPDVFTEWWATGSRYKRDVPVLREYRDRNGCRHYLAGPPEAAATEESA